MGLTDFSGGKAAKSERVVSATDVLGERLTFVTDLPQFDATSQMRVMIVTPSGRVEVAECCRGRWKTLLRVLGTVVYEDPMHLGTILDGNVLRRTCPTSLHTRKATELRLRPQQGMRDVQRVGKSKRSCCA